MCLQFSQGCAGVGGVLLAVAWSWWWSLQEVVQGLRAAAGACRLLQAPSGQFWNVLEEFADGSVEAAFFLWRSGGAICTGLCRGWGGAACRGLELVVELAGGCAEVGGCCRGLPGYCKGFNT